MRRSSQGLLEPLPTAATAPTRPPPRGPGRRRSWFWRYRRVWFLVGLLGFTALAGLAWIVTQVPLPPEAPQAQTTIVYDANGAQLATLHGVENRFPVSIDQVPQIVQAAVVAAEDRKFYQHGAIDPFGIIRATSADIRHSGATQGGSTITQQLVKNVYVGKSPTLWRKIREAVISVKLERKLTKRQILERYLNTVYFGRGAYGVQAASRAYFNKDVGQLELKDAAYLAGLIRSPSGGDVVDDPTQAHDLRFIVLQSLTDTRVITPEDANQVESVPVGDYVVAKPSVDSEVNLKYVGAEYFEAYVEQQLFKLYPEDQVRRGGMRVYTTLDPNYQRLAYDAVYGMLDKNSDPAGSLVSLDNDGHVVAMVGGKDWSVSQVNLAVGTDGGGSGRQAGSTFKPFVLAEAMNQGVSLEATPFPGPAKIVLPKADNGQDWEVNNYEGSSYGRISLLDATANSVNTVYAQLVVSLKPQNVVDMAHRLGIKSDLSPNASIALGTGDVSVLEMADSYLTLAPANKGMQVTPRVIRKVTQNGSVLLDDRPQATRVIDRGVAEKVDYALQQVVERGSGTAAALKDAQVWGKTGTTDSFGDAWFVGFTRNLTTAVWMGYPQGQSKPLYNVHGVAKVNGGSLPAQIFNRFMSKANRPDDTTPGTVPDLSGKSLSPVASVQSSGSSSGSGSGSYGGSDGSGGGSTSRTTEADSQSTATTVARQAPVSTPSQSPAPATPPVNPVVPTTPPATTPRAPRTTFTIPDITAPTRR